MKKIDTNLKNLSFIEKIKVFLRMITQVIKGKYKPNKWNLILSFLSVIYVISPIDIIPEIPFGLFGLLDDAAILAFAYSKINKEILSFLEWENQQTPKDQSVLNID